MTTTSHNPVTAGSTPIADAAEDRGPARPKQEGRFRWTRKQYYELGKRGYFEGRRVYLWEGEIIEMPPQGNWHVVTIERVARALRPHFPDAAHWIRYGNPVELPNDSEPEPDLAVIRGSPDDCTAHPTTALLVVEVSASSLAMDRKKANGYAASGVPEYWIVDVANHQIEVHRRPEPQAGEDFGHKYQSVEILRPGATIVPVAASRASVAVSDLLPRQPVPDPGT